VSNAIARKKIKFEEEALSEIMIADTRLRIKKMFSDSRVAVTNTGQ
jgi:ribosomal protein L19E